MSAPVITTAEIPSYMQTLVMPGVDGARGQVTTEPSMFPLEWDDEVDQEAQQITFDTEVPPAYPSEVCYADTSPNEEEEGGGEEDKGGLRRRTTNEDNDV